MKVLLNGRRGVRSGDDEGRVPQVGDEVALEPAQKTLLLVAAERRALAAVFPAPEGDPRRARAGLREAVEVRGAGDEGVRRQREQQQAGRRAGPHEPLRLTAQLLTQIL
jgi:hypothetical protein